MIDNIPDWVYSLKKNDHIMIVFPYTNETLYAEVVDNDPHDLHSQYIGILTVNYINKFTRHEDLLYDDYCINGAKHSNWFAYQVV